MIDNKLARIKKVEKQIFGKIATVSFLQKSIDQLEKEIKDLTKGIMRIEMGLIAKKRSRSRG